MIQASISLYPTSEQIEALLSAPDDGPVVMVNLLRFKAVADAPDKTISGEEAYSRYADKMVPFVQSKGGRLIWLGRVDSQVIGGGGDHLGSLAQPIALSCPIC